MGQSVGGEWRMEEAQARMSMRNISDGALSALSSTQGGIVVSMQTVSPDVTGDALRKYVAEMFPPAHLFCREVCDIVSICV